MFEMAAIGMIITFIIELNLGIFVSLYRVFQTLAVNWFLMTLFSQSSQCFYDFLSNSNYTV